MPADQHAKHHLVTTGERDLSWNHPPAEPHIHQHHQAILRMPGRAANCAPVVNSTFDQYLVEFAVLPRMHGKTNPVFAVAFELFEPCRVEGRRLRARVDFGL